MEELEEIWDVLKECTFWQFLAACATLLTMWAMIVFVFAITP